MSNGEYDKECCEEKYGKDGSREGDDTEGSQEENGSPKEDHIKDSCNKQDELSLLNGTHETQETLGGEADLQKHFVSCKKNPGHSKFVSVNDFNINHLPKGYHDNYLVEAIRAIANLTVRVDVTMTSTARPEFWPKTIQPYPFYDKRGLHVMRLVRFAKKLTEEDIKEYNSGTCRCHKCQHSDTPSKVWGEVGMYTATHVVFDDLEARHTTCRLFFDGQDSPLLTLDGWTVGEANIEEDLCYLQCVTCDVDLLDKLDKMERHWRDLWVKVNENYRISRDKLLFIVSHPHGRHKQISVGHWIDKYEVSKLIKSTKYTYTTCTCPGSSGASVNSIGYYADWPYYANLVFLPRYFLWYCYQSLIYSLGYDGWYYDHHVHSGVNSEGINFSCTGRGWP